MKNAKNVGHLICSIYFLIQSEINYLLQVVPIKVKLV